MFQVEDVVDAIDRLVRPVDVLLADGGASANPFLMQLQADISGRVVRRAEPTDLSPLGAAHLAGRPWGSGPQRAGRPCPPAHGFEPTEPSDDSDRRRAEWHSPSTERVAGSHRGGGPQP